MSEPAIHDQHIGITTTIPVEALFAAGKIPVDCNNIFITGTQPAADVARAEGAGFPRTLCAWVKGIYGVIKRTGIRTLIGVVEGDCSETGALMDVLESEGVRVIPFAFSRSQKSDDIRREITALCSELGTTWEEAQAMKPRLDAARSAALAVDDFAATHPGSVLSGELFSCLINTSDFQGDPEAFTRSCEDCLHHARERTPNPKALRLGIAGIPPILTDFNEVLTSLGVVVAYHEIPRQFALMARTPDLAESYTTYTYPYGIAGRVADIRAEVQRRKLDGIIHYVQSFCHRQIHDRLLREALDVPVLTVEGDAPGSVDARTRTRVEAFCETLNMRKGTR